MTQAFAFAQEQNAQIASLPAPTAGIDELHSLREMAPNTAIFAFNMIPRNSGMLVREGWIEWANGMTGFQGVKSILPLQGPLENQSEDRLFVANQSGIWDYTTEGETTPNQELVWPTQTPNAGYTQWAVYSTDAGFFLLVTDDANGYYKYESDTQTWTIGGVTGPAPGDESLVNVEVWKNRVWFVERDSTRAWYLPIGSITGNATKFDFGTKFRRGGHLVAIYNWTMDGGQGIDDFLVAVSSGGDVVVYQGTDPAAADSFSLVGTWVIGNLPAGRRVAREFGGDLLLLTVEGLVSVQELFRGAFVGAQTDFVTSRITQSIRRQFRATQNQIGWEVSQAAPEGVFIVQSPIQTGFPGLQFVMNSSTRAWGVWRDISMQTNETWHDNLYYGDEDGSLWVQRGGKDNVTIADPNTGIEIYSSILGAYNHLGAPGRNKRVQFIRPIFLATQPPVYLVRSEYNYATIEAPQPAGALTTGDQWDSGLWDQAIWAGLQEPVQKTLGSMGMGTSVAIALTCRSVTATLLVGYDAAGDAGGFF